jgi:hypothetical protein
MNNYQINRFKMYGMVIDILSKNGELLNDFPGYAEKYEAFLRHYEEIKAASGEQSEFTDRESILKKQRRRNLEMKTLHISQKLKAYAFLQQNNELLANCSFSPWELSRKKQLDLIFCSGNLHILAEEHIGNLKPYGITPDLLKGLKEAYDAYYEVFSEPRMNDVNSSVATKSMARAYKNADEALRFIDLVASIKRDTDAGFYSMYKSNRKQLKAGSVKMALKANAVDKESGKPVPNVIFTFVLTSPVKKKMKKKFQIVKKTRRLGGFKIMHMPAGEYEVVVTRHGYLENRLHQEIIDSVLVRMVVEMEASGVGREA